MWNYQTYIYCMPSFYCFNVISPKDQQSLTKNGHSDIIQYTFPFSYDFYKFEYYGLLPHAFQRMFTPCVCVCKVITWVWAKQSNFVENAAACSKRKLRARVATRLQYRLWGKMFLPWVFCIVVAQSFFWHVTGLWGRPTSSLKILAWNNDVTFIYLRANK